MTLQCSSQRRRAAAQEMKKSGRINTLISLRAGSPRGTWTPFVAAGWTLVQRSWNFFRGGAGSSAGAHAKRRPRHQQKRHALILLRHKTRNVQRGAACGACYYALAPLAGRGQCMNLNKLGRVRGKGKPPHPFFVVALPNSLSPQAGRGHNNDRLISCDAVRLKRNRRASQNLTTPRHPGLPKRGILGVAKRRDDTLRLDAVDQRKIVRRARMHVPALKQRAAGFHEPLPRRP